MKHIFSLPINPPWKLLGGPGSIKTDLRVPRAVSARPAGQRDPARIGEAAVPAARYAAGESGAAAAGPR